MNQNNLGILIFGHFFSHIQCLGAVRGFWLVFFGGKGPYLGVFPILQYKRPQGEEGFFLEISNLKPGLIWICGSPILVARYPTKAPIAGKRVELKRRGGEEAGIG